VTNVCFVRLLFLLNVSTWTDLHVDKKY